MLVKELLLHPKLFMKERTIQIGLTYDDVLLVPSYSEILPRETDIKTMLTRDISLNIPLISSAMDTVTEYRMAIAMASAGGIGVIHKNMSIEKQAAQVRRVKREESGMISDPITLAPQDTLQTAMQIMSEHKVGGIPVVDNEHKLVGIITNRDLRFEVADNRPISQIMTTENLITVPIGTTLTQAEDILKTYRIEKLPVIDKNGKLSGLITYRDIIKRKHYPSASKDSLGRLLVGAAVGVSNDTFARIEALLKAGADVITIDTAHAHSKGVLIMVQEIKKKYKDIQLIVGNVATKSGSKAAIEAGADAVKVGIGPGSICTTRVVAGIGVPQLTAVMEAVKGTENSGIPIIADGGIKHTGDLPKAFAVGASTVMIGNLLAGTDESPGETILMEGRKFKSYRGMGSIEAMEAGSKDRYFQDVEEDIKKLVPEGIVGRVPFKGSVAEVLHQFIGGLRAGMGYCGAKKLTDLQNNELVQISWAGFKESHPHSIQITKESPNYSQS